MKKQFLVFLSGLSLWPLVVGQVHAGAWLQPERIGFWKLSWLEQRSEQRWDCRGNEIAADSAGAYEQWQLFAYGEYGLREWLTLSASSVYKDQRIAGDSTYGTRGIGDLRLGARLPLRRTGAPVSVEIIASIPTYERSDLSDVPADRPQYLPAGSGRIESELHLLGGASLWPLPFYLNADLGYRSRGGQFVDQWLATLELGGGTGQFFGKSELRLTLPRHEECAEEGAQSLGTVALSERNVAAGFEAGVRIRASLWLSGGYTHPLSGRNSLVSGVLSLGLSLWQS